jgi:hypothetical protein
VIEIRTDFPYKPVAPFDIYICRGGRPIRTITCKTMPRLERQLAVEEGVWGEMSDIEVCAYDAQDTMIASNRREDA